MKLMRKGKEVAWGVSGRDGVFLDEKNHLIRYLYEEKGEETGLSISAMKVLAGRPSVLRTGIYRRQWVYVVFSQVEEN